MNGSSDQPTLYGHPTGLFALFFAEMWERFSYYGMRALLMLYMLKGFLGYGDDDAYAVYGAYIALVYMTPFFGGMLADRVLGPRRAVVLGGVLMAAGHLLMTVESELPFYMALALLVVGNGFFKPNISTMVGSLYPTGSPKRDGGFTIFYIGINLGGAMAPLLCGYVGETMGWHWGFGLATIGMLIGLAVFVVPTMLARVLILGGALITSAAMVLLQDNALLLAVNGFVAAILVVAGASAFVALGRQGLAPELGGPPSEAALRSPVFGVPLEWAIYFGSLLMVPLGAALIWSNRLVSLVPAGLVASLTSSDNMLVRIGGTVMAEVSTPTGLILTITGVLAFGYLLWDASRSPRVEGQRILAAVVLMGFSLLFWSFFEQGGSSLNLFADRNVDRVFEERVLTEADVGQVVDITLSQEQLGYAPTGGTVFTIDQLDAAREADALAVAWRVEPEHVGMGIQGSDVPATTLQSANPVFIIIFGLVFTALWTFLARRRIEPSTPVKFALGLGQLALGFGLIWYGAVTADARGMVGMHWLLLGYMFHTTGELCLSPVGLSMVTRLSPVRLVSTMMGAWFLATAFSNFLSSIIATFTSVGGHGGGSGVVPPPADTVMLYGDVFGAVAIAAGLAALLLLILSPVLRTWMHGEP